MTLSSVWHTFLALAAVYLGLALWLYFAQSRLLFLPDAPSREVLTTPDRIGLAYQPVSITTDDAVRLDAWFVPAREARAVVLFFHGNAGNISHRLDTLKQLNGLGLSTLIFDYRGYGRSTGRPSEQGTYRDADAAWRYLAEQRSVPPERLVLFGRSLGAAVAAELASRHPPRALILESGFTSLPDVAAQAYRLFPVRWLARFDYNTAARLRSIRCPVLVIHSRDDEVIPFAHGRRLYQMANPPKAFIETRGGHNGGPWASGRHYVDGIEEFLRTHVDPD